MRWQLNKQARQIHKDMALELLLHHMGGDMREILMSELPAAYNDLMGRDIVSVRNESDGSLVRPVLHRKCDTCGSAMSEKHSSNTCFDCMRDILANSVCNGEED